MGADASSVSQVGEGPSNATSRTPFLTPAGAWSYGVGTAIGWGSLVVTSSQYLLQAGPIGSVLGIVVGTLVMALIAWSYSRMMDRYPDAGGSYTYVCRVLGPDYGFVLGWFLSLTYLAVLWANATSLPLFARHFLGDFFKVGYLYTIFGYDVYLGEALLTVAAVTLISVLCTRDGPLKQRIMIALALVFVVGIALCFCAAMLAPGAAAALAPTPPAPARGVAALDPAFLPDRDTLAQVAVVGLMAPWAFIGFESISNAAEEFAFPRRRYRRVLMGVVVTTAVLYVMIVVLSASAYPERYDSWFAYLSDLGNLQGIESLPAFYAAGVHLGDAGVTILMMSLLALVLSSLVGNIVVLGHLFVALARDGMVPRGLASLNEKGAPTRAILLVLGVSVIIPFLGRTSIAWIIDITTIGAVIAYGLVSLAEMKAGMVERSMPDVAAGAIGAIVMVAFGLATLVPNLFAGSRLAHETYLLITVWSVLGFIYFRFVLSRKRENAFGDSVIIWAFLLSLVLFTSTVWMQQVGQAKTLETVNNIEAYLSDHRGADESEYVQHQMEELSRANMNSSLVMVGMFALAMFMMTSNHHFMRRRQEQSNRELGEVRSIAYTDPLTGVKSKSAYVEVEHGIDKRIATGDMDAFAVVVCDVNGLKLVNDMLGHKAGDEYIRDACHIVCSHFKHSPVFRIGGDEFVVVTEGEDLRRVRHIMSALDEEVEANIGTPRAVVSAAFSTFRPESDRKFQDVFERADARMYERKAHLKKMGATVRD